MVDDHDDIVHMVVDIFRVTHASTMISTYKMYYSLCWTQRCMIQYHTVREQVAACAYKNSVFFECFFDRQLDDCCRLFVSWLINSATLNIVLLQNMNSIPSVFRWKALYNQPKIRICQIKIILAEVSNSYLIIDDIYLKRSVSSPLFCDSRQTCAIKALSSSALLRRT